jgi:hypothetical protein
MKLLRFTAPSVLLFHAAAMFFGSSAQAAKTQWEAICKQYKFKCLALPVASMPAGALIHRTSQAVTSRDCFTGKSDESRSLGAASQTRKIESDADLNAALGDYARAVGSMSQFKSVTVTFNDLSVKGFSNVRPSTAEWDVCHQELKKMEMIGEVLYFGSMDLSIETAHSTELAAKMKQIQTDIGALGAEAKVSVVGSNTLRVSGTSLALGYKPMEADFDDKLSNETLKVNKIEKLKALIDSDFEVEFFNPPLKSGANFRVTNYSIPDLRLKELTLEPHQPVTLAHSANYHATLELVQNSERKADVRLRQWNFKAIALKR